MGVLERFTSIMSSNINALLDKCEDPSKMVDQYLREAKEDLAETKRDTAEVMAEEKRCLRELTEIKGSIDKYTTLARKAIEAGSDDDARTFLTEKNKFQAMLSSAEGTYAIAKKNADQMRELHNKLVSDIQTLESKRNQVKSISAVAKTQKRMNKMAGTGSSAIGRFNDMEGKVQGMLDKAEAEAELNRGASAVDDLASKYAAPTATDTDAELAALKASMGK